MRRVRGYIFFRFRGIEFTYVVLVIAAWYAVILLEDGYTDKKVNQIHHDFLIKDFVGVDNIVSKFLND